MNKFIFIVIIAASLLAGCANTNSDDQNNTTTANMTIENDNTNSLFTGMPKLTLDNYPKMGGSLACLPLGEALTANCLSLSREKADEIISFAGSTTDNYRWILDGTFDIILAYEPSEEAKKLIAESGEELLMTPIGVDALVFIGNKSNPVDNLTLEDITKIYQNKVSNWSELGGNDEEVAAFIRNSDSGSQTLFDKLINIHIDKAAYEKHIANSMIGLLETIAKYDDSEGAIGYTVYYYLTKMEADTLETTKIFSFNGVQPDNDTIASGKYSLSNEFYVVIKKSADEKSPERQLYNYLTGKEGKELVRSEGYAVKEN